MSFQDHRDANIQVLVNQINNELGNYGKTIDLSRPVYLRKGIDSEMVALVDAMNEGGVDALLIVNTNPAYHFPDAEKFTSGLKKTGLSICLSSMADETSAICQYVCPSGHYLESWGDAEPCAGVYSLQQPLINPVFNTRQWEESLLRWSGNPAKMQDYVKGFWEKRLFPQQQEKKRFYDFWVVTLQNGVFEPASGSPKYPEMRQVEVPEATATGMALNCSYTLPLPW